MSIFALSPQAQRLHQKRKLVNVVALMLALMAMAFGLFWLIWILIETVRLGVGGLALTIFTEMTPPPQADKRNRKKENIKVVWIK